MKTLQQIFLTASWEIDSLIDEPLPKVSAVTKLTECSWVLSTIASRAEGSSGKRPRIYRRS